MWLPVAMVIVLLPLAMGFVFFSGGTDPWTVAILAGVSHLYGGEEGAEGGGGVSVTAGFVYILMTSHV